MADPDLELRGRGKGDAVIFAHICHIFDIFVCNTIFYTQRHFPVADPDLELRGRGKGDAVIFACTASFSSFCDFFFVLPKKGGGERAPRPPPLDPPLLLYFECSCVSVNLFLYTLDFSIRTFNLTKNSAFW